LTSTTLTEVIVVGLGAIGSATLYQLARRGIPAIGIDRFTPPHDRGSSHGESRITRLAVGEGDDYAPLVRRSHAIWHELERETGASLLHQVGGLIIGDAQDTPHHGKPGFLKRTIAVAERHAIAHEVLAAAEIAYRFPQLLMTGGERGYYEPEAGMVFPERCIAVQLDQARRFGATLRLDEQVVSVTPADGAAGAGVTVTTTAGRLQAPRVVLAAGPWLPGLLGTSWSTGLLRIFRQTLHWFPTESAGFAPERCPVFLWMHGSSEEDYFYGFPRLPGSAGIKVASERYARTTTADGCDRQVTSAESSEMFRRHVSGRLRDVGGEALRAAACLYTVTPDSGFLVDSVPELPGALVASACSGHGFKHSAALGEHIAALIAGEAEAAAALAGFGLPRLRAAVAVNGRS
jgi:sarcosine oxidase